jgi:hypothetical protein
MKISEKAKIKTLAANVINGAAKDLLFGDPVRQVEALEFLVSKDFAFWATVANMDLLNPKRILENPARAREALRNPRRYYMKEREE